MRIEVQKKYPKKYVLNKDSSTKDEKQNREETRIRSRFALVGEKF